MPHSLSAKKRHRQNLAHRARNRSIKSSVKTQIRKVREAIVAKNLAQAETEFRLACVRLDRAAAHRVIHRNVAARTKSRLSGHIRALKQAAAPAAAGS
jgi:small subunit ribosomal protein S20